MGTGTEVDVNEGAQDGNGDGSEERSGDGNGDEDNGTRIGSGRAEERRKSARNRKIVVDAVRETGETRVEREKKCRKERVG